MSERTAVYRLFDPDRRLLYVGISVRALGRMAEHSGDKAWWTRVATITLAWFDSRAAAEAEETRAIQAERPAHNRVAGHQSPGGGITPNRVFRMREEWEQLGRAVGPRQRSEIIRQLIRWYLRYPGAKLPERPSPEAAAIFREGSGPPDQD
jgi:hypothetical protein